MNEPAGQAARDRLTHSLIIALLTAAVIFIARQIWEVLSQFVPIILLFGIAWLIAFILSPFTRYLSGHPVPAFCVRFLRRQGQPAWATRLDRFRLPHAVAVLVVYSLLLFVVVLTAVFAIPALVGQLVIMAKTVPRLVVKVPHMLDSIQRELALYGFKVDLSALYQPSLLAARAEAIGAEAVQQSINLATKAASGLASFLLVIALSLYMSLDQPRLARQLRSVIPDHFYGRMNLVGQSLSRTFGGFMRGQLLMALLYGLPAALAMAIAGIPLAGVMGAVCGLLMLIPLIGAPIAMLLPGIAALIQAPGSALWLFIVMTAYQQVLLHAVAPKVMAEVLGMPPLLVLLAMLASMRVVGVWGLVFGIPLAGVIYAFGSAYLEQAKIRRESLPRGIGDGAGGSAFRLPAMGPGCLLVPDILSPPGELQPVAQYLASRGITTLGVEPYRSLGETSWEDWYSAVMLGLDQLWRDCNQVFILGKGTGALLALHAASELPVAAAACLSVPLTRDADYHSAGWDAAQAQGVETSPSPEMVLLLPSRTRQSLVHLQERVHGELAQVAGPVLILHPQVSLDISPEDARYVLERLGSTHKRIEWVDLQPGGSYDWNRIAQVCFSFLRNYIQ